MSLKKFVLLLTACVLIAVMVCGCSFEIGSGSGSASSTQSSKSEESLQTGSSSNAESSKEEQSSGGKNDGSDGGSVNSSATEPDPSDEDIPVELFVATDKETVQWNNVAAGVYEVTVDGKTYTTVSTEFKTTGLAVGVYEVKVTAYLKLNPVVTVTAFAELVIKSQPPVLKSRGNEIYWAAVEGAVGYAIYKENTFIAQESTTSYTAEPGIYTVVVVFDDQRLNSTHSNSVVVGEVEVNAPTLSRDGDYIRWTAVDGAAYYEIYVNGEAFQIVFGTSYKFKPTYDKHFSEDFPDGVTVTVVACFNAQLKSSQSNQIFFSV